MKTFLFFTLLSLSFSSQAKLLQIIHTNDLHSYFLVHSEGKGGYARLKTKIDEIKAQAAAQGIPTLILDGGDFGEGTSFFLSDGGADSIRALGVLGTEASVVGNHDYMLGGNVLSQQIRNADIPTKILSANMVQTPDMDLADLVRPYADFNKDGLNIRVIGLTTAEPHYQYAFNPGFINEPTLVGNIEAKKAKDAGFDLVIALTHIGSYYDKLLVKSSTNIDLVVGGHDHLHLEKALMVKNKNKREIPIVQAGSHGVVLGSLLIDVKPGSPVEIVDYKLHEIVAPLEEDPLMLSLIDQAYKNRNDMFDGRFDEVIGFSEIKLTGYENGHAVIQNSCWGEHMAKMATVAAGADIGVHLALFEGMTIAPGEIKYGDLIDNFPHIKNIGDPGWEIASFETDGKTLKTILRVITSINKQIGFSFYGVTYRSIKIPITLPYVGDLGHAWNFKINGQKLDKKKKYRMAFPREIADALKVMMPSKLQAVFPKLENSGKFFWPVMEEYVKENSPIKCLSKIIK